jgi:hypothetical protein
MILYLVVLSTSPLFFFLNLKYWEGKLQLVPELIYIKNIFNFVVTKLKYEHIILYDIKIVSDLKYFLDQSCQSFYIY